MASSSSDNKNGFSVGNGASSSGGFNMNGGAAALHWDAGSGQASSSSPAQASGPLQGLAHRWKVVILMAVSCNSNC
jgi:hypothetical protein